MSDMDFSALFQPRQNNYSDYFTNYSQMYQPRQQNDFFDPKDPQFQDYVTESAKPPSSKGFIEDYINRQPDESDYAPSLGRKLLAVLGGTLSGLHNPVLAQANAQKIVRDPFNQAESSWKDEGLMMPARAKAMDEAQNRGLSAMKLGLIERAKAAKEAELAKQRAASGGNTYAGGASRVDSSNLANLLGMFREQNNLFQDKLRNEFTRQGLEIRRDLAGLAHDRYENPNTRPATPKTRDLNNEIADFSSRQGVPNKYGKRTLSAHEQASQAAIIQIIRDYPGIGDKAFTATPDEFGNQVFQENPQWWAENGPVQKAIKSALSGRTNQFLLGKF